jgi:hypothetical protein
MVMNITIQVLATLVLAVSTLLVAFIDLVVKIVVSGTPAFGVNLQLPILARFAAP